MTTESRRPLAWEILNNVNVKVKSGASEEIERLSRESAEGMRRRSERAWWLHR